jgi:uncharacterized membrane protein
MIVIVAVVSVLTVGLVLATRNMSIAPRNVLFEILSLAVLSGVSLFTYFGIKKNLDH